MELMARGAASPGEPVTRPVDRRSKPVSSWLERELRFTTTCLTILTNLSDVTEEYCCSHLPYLMSARLARPMKSGLTFVLLTWPVQYQQRYPDYI